MPNSGNVISGNTENGIEVLGTGSTKNLVQGNIVGPDSTGDKALAGSNPTQPTGILISDSVGNSIGEIPTLKLNSDRRIEMSLGGNVISANQVGIQIGGFNSTSTGYNTIIGNYIGIGLGASSLGNAFGVWINNVPGNLITDNVISANSKTGIYINGANASGNKDQGTSANVVQGNIIGLGPDGKKTYLPIPSKGAKQVLTHPFPIGVYIEDSSNNTVGGPLAGQRNVISDNVVGVYIFGKNGSSSNNQIIGNWIGLAADGSSSYATQNQFYGVILFNAPANDVPQSGSGANTIRGSGIANFREYSGPATTTKKPRANKAGPIHRPKKAAHPAGSGARHSAGTKAAHSAHVVHSRSVPAGPLAKARAGFKR